MECKIFGGSFKKLIKVYILLHFSSDLLQIFRKYFLLYKKKKLLINFFTKVKKQVVLLKKNYLKFFKVQSKCLKG